VKSGKLQELREAWSSCFNPTASAREEPWSEPATIWTEPVKSSSNLSVSPEGWLSALTSPDHEVEIDFNHVPAFYRAQRGWYTEPPPFGQHLIYLVVKGTFRAQVQETGYEVGPGTLFWLSPWTAFRCWLPGEKPGG